MSVNLFGRVKQAKACYPYPSEFWLHMLMICHRKSDIRKLEDKLLKNKHLKKIENEELLDGESKKEQATARVNIVLPQVAMFLMPQYIRHLMTIENYGILL